MICCNALFCPQVKHTRNHFVDNENFSVDSTSQILKINNKGRKKKSVHKEEERKKTVEK